MKTTRFRMGDHLVIAVPVLRDNFVYLVGHDGRAVLIDAGEAEPVVRALETEHLQLTEIFITHTHHDHVDGCRKLCDQLGVLANSPAVEEREYAVPGTGCRSISSPGHMALHKMYYFAELGVLFTGDTLINGACGRVLGGTMEQHYSSFQKIKALPDDTILFGGHDYLVENMRFALAVDPKNAAAKARLERYRIDPAAAIFATLAEEKETNPFLRAGSLDAFSELRRRKDSF